ncbi:MAG: YiiD C-terminal domain-containing protein [Lacipirellulaceae bacterium]
MSSASPQPVDPATPPLERLRRALADEIPLAVAMGVTADSYSERGLGVSMPLARNRNPHQTAFAGSLNALCTIAGWGMCEQLLAERGLVGGTVLRRSSIKYHRPVESPTIVAVCLPPRDADLSHFDEMLREKGQAKLDLVVEVRGPDPDRPAVLFSGSYVVHLRVEG